MILQASNGCLLTQSEEVPISERRFEKSMIVSSMEEAALWKEIPESEKDSMIEEGNLFYPNELSYDFLSKLNSLVGTVSQDINNLKLTNTQALKVKRFFPEWADLFGQKAEVGFKFRYNDVLLEVITPHTFSADNIPAQQPLLLSVSSEDNTEGTVYYQPVLPEVEVTATEALMTSDKENENTND